MPETLQGWTITFARSQSIQRHRHWSRPVIGERHGAGFYRRQVKEAYPFLGV
jgi:hypothetical protein